MSNELELLTINAAADSWVDLIPDEVSTGYQAQNTNIEARSNGLDSLFIEVSGTDAIFNPSGVVDDNGAPMVVKTQVTLAVPSGQRFVRVIDGVDPTKRSLQLESSIGAYDESKNGYYTSGDRMLNWSLNDISGSLKSYKILAPLHAHILGDVLFDGNVTQTSGVTNLLATTIAGNTLVNGELRVINDVVNLPIFLAYNTTDLAVGELTGIRTLAQNALGTNKIVDFAIDANNLSYGWGFGTVVGDLPISAGMQYTDLFVKAGRFCVGTAGIDNGIDLIQGGVGQDKSFAFGRSRIGGINANMVLSYYTMANSTDFAIKQNAVGTTSLNSKAGQILYIVNGGVDVSAQFSGSAIDLLKPTTITGHLNVSTYGLFGGAIYDAVNNLNVNGNGILSGALIAANAKIGAWVTNSDFARFGHTSFDGGGNYGYLQDDNSDCYIAGNTINLQTDTVNVEGHVNPTTTPTETTISRTTIGTTNIPRGNYNIEIQIQITVSGATNPEIYLEQLSNGTWYTVASITGVGLVGTYTSFVGVGFRSTGSDLRISVTSGNGTYECRANIRKY